MQRFTTYDGIAIAYDVIGDGPPVLAHHGFASDSRTNWVRPGVVAAIAETGRSVVLIDARGHGESDKPHDTAAYSNGAMTNDARALLDELGLEEVDVLGYSMGAFVAMSLALSDHRVRTLIVGGAGRAQIATGAREQTLAIADALESDDPSGISNPMARAFRNFADATGADRHALAAIQRGRSGRPGLEALSKISVPTLVVNGDRDTMVGDPKALADTIPGARAVLVPGDHLSAVVSPEFRQVIVKFLDEAAPVGR